MYYKNYPSNIQLRNLIKKFKQKVTELKQVLRIHRPCWVT